MKEKNEEARPLEETLQKADDLAVEEFSIAELEDRLELAAVDCCNNNCGCPAPV